MSISDGAPARSRRVRAHLRWIIPLVLAPVTYLLFGYAAYVLGVLTADDDVAATFGQLALLAAAVLVPVAALIVAIVQAVRVHGQGRRARGRFTAQERAVIDTRDRSTTAWQSAADLRALLLARQLPAQVEVWDVVPGQGEVFFLDTSAEYFRYYGQDVSYTRTSGFYFGRPAFVAAGIAVSAIGNVVNRSVAVAQAQAQWREHQQGRLLVSNQRLVCQVNGGQWLSFPYSSMTAIHPEVETWTFIAQFGTAAPLMLRGIDVPAAAVIATLMTHGPDALAQHPGLQPLTSDAE